MKKEILTKDDPMITIRKIIPNIKTLNDKCSKIYLDRVGLIGPQGICGPINDFNVAIQYLDGASTLLKSVADHYGIKYVNFKREGK